MLRLLAVWRQKFSDMAADAHAQLFSFYTNKTVFFYQHRSEEKVSHLAETTRSALCATET